MDFPRLSPMQYLTNAALVAVGGVGIWLPSQVDLVGSVDGRPLPVILGAICIAAGVIPIVAKRWHVALIVLMLLATIAGAMLGRAVWESRHPDFPRVLFRRDVGGELAQQRWEFMGWCAIPAAVVVPLAVAASRRIPKAIRAMPGQSSVGLLDVLISRSRRTPANRRSPTGPDRSVANGLEQKLLTENPPH